MFRRFVCLILLALVATVEMRECHGQIVRRIRDRRAAVAAAMSDTNAATAATAPANPATVPPAPLPLPLRGGFLARRLQQRRDLVAQQAAQAQPTPASPALPPQQQAQALNPQTAQQRTAPRPQDMGPRRAMQALQQASAFAAPAIKLLTQNEMAGMEVPALQTALSDTSGTLSNELTKFSSAPSWQEFFTLPGSVVDEGTIDLAALQTALVRFENVAANPKFAQIAELPSFHQARTLLTELVNRVDVPANNEPLAFEHIEDGPQLIDPATATELSAETEQTGESLPTPPRPMNHGEHSILVRSRKG